MSDVISKSFLIETHTQHNCDMRRGSLLLLDDDSFARTTLASALSGIGYNVTSLGTASEAVEVARQKFMDAALLDLDLGPGPSGIDVSHVLRRINSQVGLVFLTSYSDPRFLLSYGGELPTGARYLVKSKLTEISSLTNLIDQTIRFPMKNSKQIPKSEHRLTRTQVQILKLLAAGGSTTQIAQELDISVKSVEAVISRMNAGVGESQLSQNKRVNLANFYYRLIGKL